MTIDIIRKTCTKCKAVEGDVKFRYGANICNKCRGQQATRQLAVKKNSQTDFEKFYSNEKAF
jgi:hypothetical protein